MKACCQIIQNKINRQLIQIDIHVIFCWAGLFFMWATGWINGSISVATAYFSSLMTELWVDSVLACKDFSRADECVKMFSVRPSRLQRWFTVTFCADCDWQISSRGLKQTGTWSRYSKNVITNVQICNHGNVIKLLQKTLSWCDSWPIIAFSKNLQWISKLGKSNQNHLCGIFNAAPGSRAVSDPLQSFFVADIFLLLHKYFVSLVSVKKHKIPPKYRLHFELAYRKQRNTTTRHQTLFSRETWLKGARRFQILSIKTGGFQPPQFWKPWRLISNPPPIRRRHWRQRSS